jgi:hypothetical protein
MTVIGPPHVPQRLVPEGRYLGGRPPSRLAPSPFLFITAWTANQSSSLTMRRCGASTIVHSQSGRRTRTFAPRR